MAQPERLYWIDAQIRDGRYPNADRVAEHFNVSRRSAYMDRDYLLYRLNAPLDFDRTHGGWVYTDTTFLLPFMALSEKEGAALRRSLLAAQEYLGPADAQAVGLLLERFAAYIPAAGERESIGGSMQFATEAQVDEALLSACRKAVRNRQRLSIRYFSAHRDATDARTVQPYHLHYFQGEPHLLAWCEWKQAFRQFFLGRVQEWELLEPDAAFARDPAFDAESYWQRGLGLQHGEPPVTVRARFSAYQARWIRERRYHPSQQIEEEPDGGLILTLHVSGMAEVQRWLLSYGAEVEVLAPEELRVSVAAQAKKLAEIYCQSAE